MTKDSKFQIRMTDEEKRSLEKAAEQQGVGLSKFIRQRLILEKNTSAAQGSLRAIERVDSFVLYSAEREMPSEGVHRVQSAFKGKASPEDLAVIAMLRHPEFYQLARRLSQEHRALLQEVRAYYRANYDRFLELIGEGRSVELYRKVEPGIRRILSEKGYRADRVQSKLFQEICRAAGNEFGLSLRARWDYWMIFAHHQWYPGTDAQIRNALRGAVLDVRLDQDAEFYAMPYQVFSKFDAKPAELLAIIQRTA